MDARTGTFRYLGFDTDRATGQVSLRYATDDDEFTEVWGFGPAGDWDQPAVHEALRLLFLLAGVSYYKTTAAGVVDLGDLALREPERLLVQAFYLAGLGEFSCVNGLDLAGVEFRAEKDDAPSAAYTAEPGRPLIPFGGGLDSVASVELLRPLSSDRALFVKSPESRLFAAIETAAEATGLPVLRASQRLDHKVLESKARGYLNGHVPVTGVVSAAAVVAAVLDHRDAVVLSNEWSASSPTREYLGRPVNHQWSKGDEFETLFADAVAASVGPALQYFSLLRSRSELWIAEKFAAMTGYHGVFHSCNRAFHHDPDARQQHWCGECDKCCFIDLILAPYLSPAALDAVFRGREPLADPALLSQFHALLDVDDAEKPFECVGDVGESRAAVRLAAARPDRAGSPLLQRLLADVDAAGTGLPAAHFLQALSADHVPDRYAAALLG